VTEERLTPWYREQVDRDYQVAAEVQAIIDGRAPARPADDPARRQQAAFLAAARDDPEVARALLDVVSCHALPAAVFGRPGIRAKVAAYAEAEPPQTPGPTRAELLALVN
jgi:hypothetical protein